MDRTNFALLLVTLATSCTRAPHEPAAPAHASTPASSETPHAVAHPLPFAPNVNTRNLLTWDDPPGWSREEPSSRMRVAQYRIPHVAADSDDAELVVITFGPGQGGATESNLERWYGQVTQPDGRPTHDVATRNVFTVNGLQVTETEAAGRIAAGMPMPNAPPPQPFDHGRLLAAIVDTPSGPWFFKITGPDATVSAARPAFETMLHSIRARDAHGP